MQLNEFENKLPLHIVIFIMKFEGRGALAIYSRNFLKILFCLSKISFDRYSRFCIAFGSNLVSQSISQSFSQLISQSINQSVSKSVTQWVT